MSYSILHGNCVEVLAGFKADSFAACICDPPYHLTNRVVDWAGFGDPTDGGRRGKPRLTRNADRGFMGKQWDGGDVAFRPETWAAVLRVLKPGAYLVAFASTRGYHRMVCAIDDVGFEIRDTITWLYGSGFPKSLDVSKAIDREAGRIGQNVIDLKRRLINLADNSGKTRASIDAACGFRAANYLTLPAEGKRPDPWVNCLPPRDKWQIMKSVLGAGDDLDDIFTHAEREVIGTKNAIPGVAFSSKGPTELDITAPATEAARQWQGWGTALKPACELICVARKPLSEGTVAANVLRHGTGAINVDAGRVATEPGWQEWVDKTARPNTRGQAHEGAVMNRPEAPTVNTHANGRWPANCAHDGSPEVLEAFARFGSSGDTPHARGGQGFHNCLGRPDRERRDGEAIAGHSDTGTAARFFFCGKAQPWEREGDHPTVKPVALMEWLVTLVTPPGGAVLDPFCGTGSTLVACDKLGIDATGIELSAETCAAAERKIKRLRARRLLGPDAPRPETLPGQLDLL